MDFNRQAGTGRLANQIQLKGLKLKGALPDTSVTVWPVITSGAVALGSIEREGGGREVVPGATASGFSVPLLPKRNP